MAEFPFRSPATRANRKSWHGGKSAHYAGISMYIVQYSTDSMCARTEQERYTVHCQKYPPEYVRWVHWKVLEIYTSSLSFFLSFNPMFLIKLKYPSGKWWICKKPFSWYSKENLTNKTRVVYSSLLLLPPSKKLLKHVLSTVYCTEGICSYSNTKYDASYNNFFLK